MTDEWDDNARIYVVTLQDGTEVRIVTAYGSDTAAQRVTDARRLPVVSVRDDGPAVWHR